MTDLTREQYQELTSAVVKIYRRAFELPDVLEADLLEMNPSELDEDPAEFLDELVLVFLHDEWPEAPPPEGSLEDIVAWVAEHWDGETIEAGLSDFEEEAEMYDESDDY